LSCRYLKITERSDVRLDTNAIKGTDGKWVIETNDDTLTPEYAAPDYKSLMVIERCFRTLKITQLKFEPVYHRLLRRIEAHVKICVMALLIEWVAELACDQSRSQLRPILACLQATEVHTLSYVLFKQNQPTQAVQNLLETLDIPFPKPILDISELNEVPLNS
jgi:transposase